MAGSLAVGYEDFCDLELAWLPLGEKGFFARCYFPACISSCRISTLKGPKCSVPLRRDREDVRRHRLPGFVHRRGATFDKGNYY